MKHLPLRVFAPLLLFSASVVAEPEIQITEIVRGSLDCYGKMSARCGGFDDLKFFSDRFQRGLPGSGNEDRPVQTKKAAPPSQNNSNKKSEENCKSTANPVVIATGEKHKTELDFAAGGRYGLGLQRTYRSMHATGTMFGPHWLSNLDGIDLTPSDYFQPRRNWPSIPKKITVTNADGSKFVYEYNVAGGNEEPPGTDGGRMDLARPGCPRWNARGLCESEQSGSECSSRFESSRPDWTALGLY